MNQRCWLVLSTAIVLAAVVGASCGDDGGSSERGSDATDAVTDGATVDAPCDTVGELVDLSEIADAFSAELQPAEGIDSGSVCLVQLDVGVVAIGLESHDSEDDAGIAFDEVRDTVVAVGEEPEELTDVGDEAFLVTGTVTEVYVLDGTDLILVGDSGSLDLDADALEDALVATAGLVADDA